MISLKVTSASAAEIISCMRCQMYSIFVVSFITSTFWFPLQVMFETYQFAGVYIAIQAVLTLYAQGKMTHLWASSSNEGHINITNILKTFSVVNISVKDSRACQCHWPIKLKK